MKTTLIFVSTLDGKVTRWGNPDVKLWSSRQDQEYYKKVWYDARLIVMGSNTFKAGIYQPAAHQQLVVMTGDPGKYTSLQVPEQVEFTNKSPQQIVTKFKGEGYDQMLVVGGPHVATSFLKEQLIDELWLTLEPKIFGRGSNFATDENLDVRLRLLQCEKVNEQGTLITKYSIVKNEAYGM